MLKLLKTLFSGAGQQVEPELPRENEKSAAPRNQCVDSRSAEELTLDIEDCLRKTERLTGFEIRKGISPEELDANSVILKHYGQKFIDQFNKRKGITEPYNANKYGKPIDFILCQDGRPCLAIIVMKGHYNYRGEYTFQTMHHHLVRWILYWCEDNKVPLMKFYQGKENREDYIIDRVCSELGV